MRKILSIGLIVLFAATFCLAGWLAQGYGRGRNATVGPNELVDIDTSYLSVYNAGTNNVYVLPNISSNDFVTAMVSTNAIRIRPLKAFTFDAQMQKNVKSLVYQTLVGASEIDIGGW